MSLEGKKIVKSITAFGGVQFINMATGIFRSKVAALWLGTQGVGFLGLLLSTFNLIVGAFNLGLPTSIVKHLSGSSEETLPKKLAVIRRLGLVIGLVSAILCFVFASPLSFVTFNTLDFSWAFRLLSISVFFKQISGIYSGILQSTSRLKQLANANVISNVIGIFFTIPLYYYFNIKGIVYNLVVIGLVEVLVFYLYNRSLKIKAAKIEKPFFISESKNMIGDGFFFNLSSFLELFSAYLLQMFISNYGSLKTLGFYVAGFTILNSSVAIIFSAMSVDYFPRVSKSKNDNNLLNKEVNQQLYVGTVIMLPILLLLLLFSHTVVVLLYSKEFAETDVYLQLAMLGMFFKLFSWILGFVILVKGSRKMILNNAIIFNLIFLIIHISAFYLYGIRGVAIGFSLYYLVYLIGVYWITYAKFDIRIEKRKVDMYIFASLILLFCIGINFLVEDFVIKKSIIACVAIFVSFWSIRRLNSIFGWIK